MVKEFRKRISCALAGWLGTTAIRLARILMRVEYVNREIPARLRAERKPYILAFWHGRLFMMPYAYDGKRVSILISQHRDGEYIARAMEGFGFSTTRGSTTAGGGAALRALVKKYREGYDLAFTPDGPRGPRYRVQPGIIQAARLTGGAILPVSFGCSKKKSSRAGTDSWFPCLFPAASSPTGSRSG